MSCRAPGRTCCGGRSCSPRARAATHARCCSRRPGGSSRSNLGLARETYLTAWIAALFAARLAGSGDLPEVSRAARALPPAAEPRPVELLLDGLALLVADGLAAAAPTLRQAVSVFAGAGLSVEDGLRWGWMAQGAASALWDNDAWHVMLVRQLQLARDAGALERLPLLLASLGTEVVWSGDFAAGAALVAEADAVCEATGSAASRSPR